MKFRQSQQDRVPGFSQIIQAGDSIAGLDQMGRVWVYIPAHASQLNSGGWMKLEQDTVEEVK